MTVIGAGATLVVTAAVVVVLLLFGGGAKAVSDNAALIGALIALGGVFTTQLVNSALEAQRAEQTRELEKQRTWETALQNYFEQVGKILIEKPLREASPDDNLSIVVRAQTLALLASLDSDRKRAVLQFLYESGLIHKEKPVVNLKTANLVFANLTAANLSGANLSGVNLTGATLQWVRLCGADLRGADLMGVKSNMVDLSGADLSGAQFVTNEALKEQAFSFEGATMPNGQKYEDWLKDKEGHR